MNTYHKELLLAGLGQRERELTEYQVNIDNFTLAIVEIGDDADLQDYKENMQKLLQSSIIEKKKTQVIYNVIKKQLEAENVSIT